MEYLEGETSEPNLVRKSGSHKTRRDIIQPIMLFCSSLSLPSSEKNQHYLLMHCANINISIHPHFSDDSSYDKQGASNTTQELVKGWFGCVHTVRVCCCCYIAKIIHLGKNWTIATDYDRCWLDLLWLIFLPVSLFLYSVTSSSCVCVCVSVYSGILFLFHLLLLGSCVCVVF